MRPKQQSNLLHHGETLTGLGWVNDSNMLLLCFRQEISVDNCPKSHRALLLLPRPGLARESVLALVELVLRGAVEAGLERRRRRGPVLQLR